MDDRVSEQYGEAGGGGRGGALGRGFVVLAETELGGRDALRYVQGLPSALCYWLRLAVHLQSTQRWMDPSRLPFYGQSLISGTQFLSVTTVHPALFSHG